MQLETQSISRNDEKTLAWNPRGNPGLRALAPSLRQYELDQVQRVTAPQEAKPHCPAVSQPLAGTPLVNVEKAMPYPYPLSTPRRQWRFSRALIIALTVMLQVSGGSGSSTYGASVTRCGVADETVRAGMGQFAGGIEPDLAAECSPAVAEGEILAEIDSRFLFDHAFE